MLKEHYAMSAEIGPPQPPLDQIGANMTVAIDHITHIAGRLESIADQLFGPVPTGATAQAGRLSDVKPGRLDDLIAVGERLNAVVQALGNTAGRFDRIV